jgi:hypothetical protein
MFGENKSKTVADVAKKYKVNGNFGQNPHKWKWFNPWPLRR